VSSAAATSTARRKGSDGPDRDLRPVPPSAARRPVHDARLVADTPARDDLLDREGFASSLAALIDMQRREDSDVASGQILMHVDGAWGSGKTSLIRLLRRGLERPPEELPLHDGRWLCVTFNAWAHQRTAPPWWWLMDSVYREARRSTRRELPTLNRRHRWRIWAWWWGFAVFALVVSAFLVMAAFICGILTIDRITGARNGINAVVGFFVASGSALALLRSTKSSLLAGSPRAATALIRTAGDPYRRIHDRFGRLVRKIRRNVLVCIDDLDRCQPSYVVELLEGIQTIFGDVPVTYLIAADQGWLSQCFQKEYADMAKATGRPGRPLGYLFLEKTFAVSAPMPRPSPAAQERYWHAVLAGEGGAVAPISGVDRRAAADEMAAISPDDAVARVVALSSADMSGPARALRERAAIKLAEAVEGGGHDHVLGPYMRLMEPNPRAFKRLRNAYAVAALARFASLDVTTDEGDVDSLIRWTILTLRWPTLANRVVEEPHLLGRIAAPAPGDDPAADLGRDLAPLADDGDLGHLLRDPVGGTAPRLAAWVVSEFD
jgi:hypothetical protein